MKLNGHRESQSVHFREGTSGANPVLGKTDILAIGDDLHETFNSNTIQDSLVTKRILNLTFKQSRFKNRCNQSKTDL